MTKLSIFAVCTAAIALSAASTVAAQTAPKPAAAAPAPAAAAPAGQRQSVVLPGIGVVDFDTVQQSANAFKAAAQERRVKYKASYDAAEARSRKAQADGKVLVDKFNADQAAKMPDSILQADYQAIQTLEQVAKQDIQQALAPVALSEAYGEEQINAKIPQAVQNAMNKNGITLLLRRDAIVVGVPNYDLSPAITAELNTLLPAIQVVPPQGWVPAQYRTQQPAAQPAPAAQSRPAATTPAKPAGPQPEGR